MIDFQEFNFFIVVGIIWSSKDIYLECEKYDTFIILFSI